MEKYKSTMTSKGQTTIPVQVREYLSINTGDEIEYEVQKNKNGERVAVIRKIGLLNEHCQIFSAVLTKVKDLTLYEENHGFKGGGLIKIDLDYYKKLEHYQNSPEYRNIKQKENDIVNYLNSLDYELIKIIQTVIYLGRDEDYNKSDSSDQRYRKVRERLDNLGWRTKDIEISQIIEKRRNLYGYIINGLYILGINLV